MLYRVHCHSREGLGVGVAVVQAVDEAVDGADWLGVRAGVGVVESVVSVSGGCG